jgi:hypothetical protein
MKIARREQLLAGGAYHLLTKAKSPLRFRVVELEFKPDYALLTAIGDRRTFVENIMLPWEEYGVSWGLKPRVDLNEHHGEL